MNAPTLPLLDLFYQLRGRNFDLGPSEYLDGLQALIAGEVTSRQQLLWVIQSLWGKTVEEQQAIASMLERSLPQRVTPEQLQKLTEHVDDVDPQRSAQQIDRSAETSFDEQDRNRSKVASPVQEEEHVDLAPLENQRAATVAVAAPAERQREIRFPADLAGELPAMRRFMKRSWRYYRRMGRSGPAVLLDVDATVQRLQRQGVLVAPVLVPRRRNLAAVLALVDQGGSMTPFQAWIEAFLDAGRHSGLAHFETLYFRNVPDEYLFRDPVLCQPVELSLTQNPLADAGVVVISDAGAGRGRLSTLRVMQTRQFLERICVGARRIAWVNPVPRSRWAGTTAGQLVQESGVPMFSMDRAGLDAAMFALRGRVS